MAYIVETDGIAELEEKLWQLSEVRLEAVMVKQITQMYQRGKDGGTPVDTGYMRNTLLPDNDALELGYMAEYAPHVEYGHRTRNGGWVEGQYFLKNNADTQREIFKQDLEKQIAKMLKKGGVG